MSKYRRIVLRACLILALGLMVADHPRAQVVCTLGPPQTFSYSGPPVPIPDNGPVVSAPVPVSGVVVVGDINVSIDGTACTTNAGATTVGIDHTFVSDLRISLRSPNNTSVTVIDETDSSGNNFCQTVLDDESAGPNIQTATVAPFTGSFKPANPLSAFDGQIALGTWNLDVQDLADIDTGNIRAFSLTIAPCLDAVPTVPMSGLAILGVLLTILAAERLTRGRNTPTAAV